MPQTLLAPIIGGAVSGGIGLIGSGMQAGATRAAAARAREDLAPFRTAGVSAAGAQTDLLGLNGPEAAAKARANFQASPGYQWSLDQGLRAVDAGAAANGLLRSGAVMKAEQTFGTGLADQEFQQYYKNLSGLSALGENAAGGTANVDVAAGNAQSSIYGNAASGLSNTVNSLFSNPDVKSWLSGSGSPVSSSTAYQNGLYQQAQFAAQPAGTYGPFM